MEEALILKSCGNWFCIFTIAQVKATLDSFKQHREIFFVPATNTLTSIAFIAQSAFISFLDLDTKCWISLKKDFFGAV